MARIAIVGGGISGLTLAYRLQQRIPRADVRVFERNERLGGTIATVERDGFRVEAGPNGFLDNNPATFDLCRELGIHDRLVAASEAARKNRYLFLGGKLQRLPSSLFSFFFSNLLSWRAKKALLLERFRRAAPAAADESIDAFARRRTGDQVAETLVEAFVTGIFAGDPRLLSMQACLPRLAAYEREHGSVTAGMAAARRQRCAEAMARAEPLPRASRMWSFPAGLGFLIDQLQTNLSVPPTLGVTIRAIGRDGDRWALTGEGKDRWHADAVVLTCPAHQQAILLADFDAKLADEIGAIPYNRVAVVALGYRVDDVPVSLDGFGYLSLQRERRDVLGVQWCSSIYPERAPEGKVLLRAMCGGWQRPEMVDWDDNRLLSAMQAELSATMGIREAPIFHHIVRWDRAIPQYHRGHLERVGRIEAQAARHPGLYVGGNAYRGVALNDCVEQAGRLADRIAADLATCGA